MTPLRIGFSSLASCKFHSLLPSLPCPYLASVVYLTKQEVLSLRDPSCCLGRESNIPRHDLVVDEQAATAPITQRISSRHDVATCE